MAYTQRANKLDIRTTTLTTVHVTEVATRTPHPNHDEIAHFSPKRDVSLIFLYSAPLLIALILASYFDVTTPWVVPLAQRILGGS